MTQAINLFHTAFPLGNMIQIKYTEGTSTYFGKLLASPKGSVSRHWEVRNKSEILSGTEIVWQSTAAIVNREFQ